MWLIITMLMNSLKLNIRKQQTEKETKETCLQGYFKDILKIAVFL